MATTFLLLLLSLDEEGAVTVMAATEVYNGWVECFQVKLLKIIRSTIFVRTVSTITRASAQ